jgi:Uma2 family endonuclease
VHQIVASRIQFELTTSLQKPGLARVVGQGAVVRMPRTQLQPDILVYPARFSPMTDWRKITEHWLAVEVSSRSSRVYDREFKRDAYFALGLEQVWLVDWRDRSVEVCSGKGKSRVVRDSIRWRVAGTQVAIDLNEVFAALD